MFDRLKARLLGEEEPDEHDADAGEGP